jgi:pilus assembly protein FimV
VLPPSAAGRRPVEPPLGDDGPLVMDEEVFSRHLGLDDDSEDLEMDLTPTSGPMAYRSASEQSKPDVGGGPAKGVSDLELNIDDLWAASDVDLESFVDATQLDHKGSEPTSGQLESRAGRGQPTPLRPVAPEASGSQRPSAMTGLFGGQDESGSSDLLTSQWQMDSGLWDEIATKLDLARAYIEMGDKESAKGILEEVVGEGNEEQRAEAGELLRRVG